MASGSLTADFAGAQAACATDGGHLAIYDAVTEMASINSSVVGGLPTFIHFVGGRRLTSTPINFIWNASATSIPNSTVLAFWKTGEPSNGGNDNCVVSDFGGVFRGLMDARR